MKEVRTLSGHNASVYALACWEATLYSASKDTTIKVWDLDTWHCIRTLSGHAGEVTALSASAQHLYSVSVDATMKVRPIHYLEQRAHAMGQIWDRERLMCVQSITISSTQRPLALCATEYALISAHASADIRVGL
jgi:WD40 repeat protein